MNYTVFSLKDCIGVLGLPGNASVERIQYLFQRAYGFTLEEEVDYTRGKPQRWTCYFQSTAAGLELQCAHRGTDRRNVKSPSELPPYLAGALQLQSSVLVGVHSREQLVDSFPSPHFERLWKGNSKATVAARKLLARPVLGKVYEFAVKERMRGLIYRDEPNSTLILVEFRVREGVPVGLRVQASHQGAAYQGRISLPCSAEELQLELRNTRRGIDDYILAHPGQFRTAEPSLFRQLFGRAPP